MGLPVKLGCAAIVTWVLIWCSSIPLGVPGEWVWTRSPVAGDFWFSLIPSICWAAVVCAVVWLGSSRVEKCARIELIGWLAAFFAASFGLLSGLQDAAPPEFRFAKVAWVLYYPGSSGYFTEARKVENTRQFLGDYERGLRNGDVLHQGTHPPGLVVGYRGLIWLCSQSRGLRQFLLATQPDDLKEAFRIIAASTVNTPTALTESDRCVIWLAALVMQVCATATIIPLFYLLRLHFSATASWQLIAFWPIVPVVTIFWPKSDTCFPFIGCLVLALWLYGLRKGSVALAFAAGCMFWLGMTLSLALLPVGFLCGLLTLWYWRGCSLDDRFPSPARHLAWGLVAGAIGFALPTFLVWLGSGCNLIVVWVWNYHNHAGFYAQFTRTYWKWLLVNPLELSLGAGLPLVVLAVSSIPHSLQHRRRALSGPIWMSLVTWSLLWLTGKNMGEAARLWIFLMPWIIWSAGVAWQDRIVKDKIVKHERGSRDTRWGWLVCWMCQFCAALAIITRVAGFSAFH